MISYKHLVPTLSCYQYNVCRLVLYNKLIPYIKTIHNYNTIFYCCNIILYNIIIIYMYKYAIKNYAYI